MTPYRVVWTRDALAELASIWMNSSNPAAVTRAAGEIDRILGRNPAESGVELHEQLRVLIFPPLRVLFAVVEIDRRVEVARVCAS